MKKIIDRKDIDSYIEFIPEMVFIKDISGIYTHVNNKFLAFLNKKKEDVIDKKDINFFTKFNSENCQKNDQYTLKNAETQVFDETYLLEDNKRTILHLKITKEVLYDLNENIIGVLSSAQDITELKQYQFLYEDNNELLEYMNKESNVKNVLQKIISLCERRNRHVICSILLLDETKQRLLTTIPSNLPSFYTDSINNLQIGEYIGSCGAAAYTKKRVIVQNINTHPNWEPFLELTQKANLHSCWSEPIFSSDDEILGTFAMYTNSIDIPNFVDLKNISSYAHLAGIAIERENKKIIANIKKRQELENELIEKNQDLVLFKQVLDDISYGVTITKADNTNHLIYANKSFENITGYSIEESLGKNCNFLQANDKTQKAIGLIKNALVNKKRIQIELRNYKKDGTLFYNLVSIAPVYDQNRNITHFVGIQKDITAEKKYEATMQEQSKLASMGEMIGNIAHQWRQPLSVISTAATGMQLQKEFNLLKEEDLIKTCDIINQNVQYLSQTIDDFKNFINKDSIQKDFNLSKNIHKFLSLVNGTVKNLNINIHLNLDDSININGYENELIQCYMNLFNNSKDALINTKKKIIIISTYTDNNQIIISIKDNAGGIPENIIFKIFEPYFTTKHKYQGTGLGLHMTYNLIKKGMKGTIKVSNKTFEHNKKIYTGAKFKITLPKK